MLTESEAQELGQKLARLVEDRGLGALAKKDYELLVFHHLTSGVALRSDGNYHLANKLKITETRVKTLRLEAAVRHRTVDHKKVLRQIATRIIEELSSPDFAGAEVSITLEDPVERREFEHAVKQAKHNVEYGMNREILKISPLAMFEAILGCLEEKEACFKKVVQKCITAKSEQDGILQKALNWRQRLNKLGAQISANNGAVALLTEGLKLLA